MFLQSLETPLAFAPLGGALLTVVWKTCGLHFLPGYEEIFAEGDAQYPVRKINLAVWNWIYLAMYGILGTVAQYNGLRISLDKPNRKPQVNPITRRRAQILGLFHCVIGLHHTLWAVADSGRLELERFDMPGGRTLIGGIVGAWTALHGFRLLTIKTGDSLDKVIRHKVVVDAVSQATYIGLFVFLPANWVGYRDYTFERNTWIVTFFTPLAILVGDLVTAK